MSVGCRLNVTRWSWAQRTGCWSKWLSQEYAIHAVHRCTDIWLITRMSSFPVSHRYRHAQPQPIFAVVGFVLHRRVIDVCRGHVGIYTICFPIGWEHPLAACI
jgi:hypothetical protein